MCVCVCVCVCVPKLAFGNYVSLTDKKIKVTTVFSKLGQARCVSLF